VLLVGYTVRTTWQLAYKNGDTPVEMLVYVQSAPDVPFVVSELDRLASQVGMRKEAPILLDGGYTDTVAGQKVEHEAISWPFEWYLRDYKGKQYYNRNLPADFSGGRYVAVLAMGANLDPVRDQLVGYTGQKFRLNWWYPEDYKQLAWDTLPNALLNASAREKLFKYVIYRDLINPPLGAREFYFYVRNDLLGPGGLASEAQPAPPPSPVGRGVEVAVSSVMTYGRAGGVPVLREPKGVASGPDGRLYVVDGTNANVTVFDREGSVVRSWGRKGAGDGEFTEPWGIAVAPDGSVFVADTWNHRIQKFDAEGRFLAKWGTFVDTQGQLNASPGNFYGPRDLALTATGELLVTDTGNKRIQVFDQAGRYMRVFGGEGRNIGQFREPVGIAVDRQGRIYVADTWNQRIQVFGPQFQPLAQYPVLAWTSQSAGHKPYLAVAPDGDIFATVPERQGILRVRDEQAALLSLRGGPRLGLPIGIEIDSGGQLIVSDAQGAVVVGYVLEAASEIGPRESVEPGPEP
jgi:DNA-binding beta-propeller fold protein YncE